MLNNSEDGSAKTNLCACNAPLLQDINFSGVKDEPETTEGCFCIGLTNFNYKVLE
jgi:hypothetical protein